MAAQRVHRGDLQPDGGVDFECMLRLALRSRAWRMVLRILPISAPLSLAVPLLVAVGLFHERPQPAWNRLSIYEISIYVGSAPLAPNHGLFVLGSSLLSVQVVVLVVGRAPLLQGLSAGKRRARLVRWLVRGTVLCVVVVGGFFVAAAAIPCCDRSRATYESDHSTHTLLAAITFAAIISCECLDFLCLLCVARRAGFATIGWAALCLIPGIACIVMYLLQVDPYPSDQFVLYYAFEWAGVWCLAAYYAAFSFRLQAWLRQLELRAPEHGSSDRTYSSDRDVTFTS